MDKKRISSKAVSLALLTALASQLAASCDDEPEHEGICMEEATQIRVDDANCPSDGGSSGGFIWVFYRLGSVNHPPVG
jgi:hypothetical protein